MQYTVHKPLSQKSDIQGYEYGIRITDLKAKTINSMHTWYLDFFFGLQMNFNFFGLLMIFTYVAN